VIVYSRCCLVVCSIPCLSKTQRGISSVPTGLCHKCPGKLYRCTRLTVGSQISDSDSDVKFFCGIKQRNNSHMVVTVKGTNDADYVNVIAT